MKKRYIVYAVIFILLGIAAFWAFYPGEDISHLKKTEDVAADRELLELVEPTVQAFDRKDRKALAVLISSHDPLLAEKMITNIMGDGRALGPVRVIKSTRLVVSHRADNVTVHVFSEPRQKSYGISFLKGKDGKYEVLAVSTSKVKP